MNVRLGRQGESHAILRVLFGLSILYALSACAPLSESPLDQIDGADYWDSGLVYHQHIDVATLSGGVTSHGLMLSGFVSAVAANANELYFIDEGAGQLVQVDLTSMTGRVLVGLLSPSVPGLHADIDGKVYAVDRAQNRILVYDQYLSDIRALPLGSFLGNPFDIAIASQGQSLYVLDNLEGNIATLDVFGGVTQIVRPELPSSNAFIAPRAIAAFGNGLMVLDGGAAQVIEFNQYGSPVGVYAEDDLRNPRALAADSCGRFYVVDDHGMYLGFADMSLPGRRVAVPELSGADVRDLWSDGIFLFVATRADGIHMLLIDPACGAP